MQMGKEPRHFMAMFKGKMLVYEGGTGRNTVDAPKTTGSQIRVFQLLNQISIIMIVITLSLKKLRFILN